MRSEWVPVSAAALVTGVMAFVLAQMLNPGGNDSAPAVQMQIAADYPGRWLAMAILFFCGAAAVVLGMPALMLLFQERRGSRLGLLGIGILTVGCVGVGALASLMLMFRALALQSLRTSPVTDGEMALVTESLKDPGLTISLTVWVYGFVVGVFLVALGLLRARQVPNWIPWLLLAFIAVQIAIPFLGGDVSRVTSAVGLLLLAAGFTGIATTAASPRMGLPVTHTVVSP